MTFKELSKLMFLGVPIENNYVFSVKENKFKESVKIKISNKNQNKLFSKNSNGFHGQFSGLFGRKLNLISRRDLGIRGKFGGSLYSSIKIKAKIIPIDSNALILNTKFQSLGRYLLWIGTPFFIVFFTLIQVISNYNSFDVSKFCLNLRKNKLG